MLNLERILRAAPEVLLTRSRRSVPNALGNDVWAPLERMPRRELDAKCRARGAFGRARVFDRLPTAGLASMLGRDARRSRAESLQIEGRKYLSATLAGQKRFRAAPHGHGSDAKLSAERQAPHGYGVGCPQRDSLWTRRQVDGMGEAMCRSAS